jgi:hypothetical protein
MQASPLSFDFLARLRRSLAACGVLFLAFTAAACGGDDDDDDDISGPAADCIDELDFGDLFFDEGDVEEISANGSESGTISTSDPELEFGNDTYYYDIYVVALESTSDVTVTVDPSGDFDADFEILDINSGQSEYVDEGGAGDTEEVDFLEIPEGCYLIFVSSPEAEGTGSYTLRLDS